MILDTLTKTIEIVLGEAMATTECDVTASWGEHAVDIFLPGGASLVTNGTTPVLVVDAPVAAATQRLVQEITLHNNDTIDHTVILHLVDGANTRIFRRVLVKAGGDFSYAPSVGVSQAQDAASYFSIVPGTPDTLVLRAPSPDHMSVATAVTTGQASGNLDVSSGDSDTQTGSAFFYSGANSVSGVSGDVGAGTGATVNGNSGTAYLWTGDSTGGGDSGNTTITTGNSSVGASGDITLTPGAGQTSSGSVIASLPTAQPGGNANGGFIALTAGNGDGTGVGGYLALAGGQAGVTANGGEIDIYAGFGGTTSGDGGALDLESGFGGAAGNGGLVTLLAGSAGSTSGDGGSIDITAGVGRGGGHHSGSITIALQTAVSGATGGQLVITGLPTAAPAVSHAVWEDTSTTPHTLRITP